MSRYFTHYWKNSTWSRGRDNWVDGDLLIKTAGSMFKKRGVEVGDAVYCITVINGTLYLAGKMIAQHICDASQAAKYLGCPADALWDAPEHIIASEATPERFDLAVPLTVTEGLRFVSGTSFEPLKFVSPGHLDVQTLRGLRELEPSSAQELDAMLPKSQKIDLPLRLGALGYRRRGQ